ncbi:MAG TPA: DUF2069 domain-containing protein [Nevskiaceae bacterium]|nr:DUF2069 domain-containing protein [Nevskiaceae bacterium]
MDHRAFFQRAVLALHGLLIVAIVVGSGFGTGALLALPLAAPLPGLWRGDIRTHAWSSMLLSFYAGGFLSSAYANTAHKWQSVGTAAIAALEFVSLLMYVRLKAREDRLARMAASAAAAP